jgi:hypothetical protein
MFWRQALNERFARAVHWDVETQNGARIARVHFEYASWARFPFSRGVKRRFEVTRKCRFALSP